MPKIALGPWMPDQSDLENGLEDAVNCVPYSDSYGPFPEAVVFSTSISARCQGAYSTRDQSGNVYTFAGDATALYRASLTGWDDVTRTAGGAYTTAADGYWDFATFGNTLLAVNGVDAMQTYTLGTSTDFRNQSASASAPVAGLIVSVRDFVVAGRLQTELNKVQWCQINNPARWTASPRLQADSQTLPSGGSIVAMTGGDFITILCSQSVWRGTYVGSPFIFRFDEVAPGIGCIARGSAARFQNLTFFLSGKGFYVFDGQQAMPIGADQVDRYVTGENNQTGDFNTGFPHRVSSVIDPVNKLYIMSYPSSASSDGTPDRMILYNWDVKRWARIEHTAELIFAGLSPGYTLETLDTLGYTLETLPFSLDSPVWQGGSSLLSGFATSHRLVNFTGTAKTARFITGEGQLIADQRAFLNALRPLVQGHSGTSIEMYVGKRDRLIDSITWTTASAMNNNGICPVRADARFHRVRMDVSASFTQAMGFMPTVARAGMR